MNEHAKQSDESEEGSSVSRELHKNCGQTALLASIEHPVRAKAVYVETFPGPSLGDLVGPEIAAELRAECEDPWLDTRRVRTPRSQNLLDDPSLDI